MAKILAGQSLSEAIPLRGNTLIALQFTSGWDVAKLTFEVSSDGTQYGPLYDKDGSEVSVTVPAYVANMVVSLIPIFDVAKIRFIKFRSGTKAAPVNQTADRNLNTLVASF